jgi:ASPIC and UnbV/FG-GAP-like repeat
MGARPKRLPALAWLLACCAAAACLSADPLDSTVDEFAAHRRERDQTVWAAEVLAQRYEATLVQLWDELLTEAHKPDGNQWAVLRRLPVARLTIAPPSPPQPIDWGIRLLRFVQPTRTLDRQAWQQLIDWAQAEHYRLVQSEWHHERFEPRADGTARSVVRMAMYLMRDEPQQRLVLQGGLVVEWSAQNDAQGHPIPTSVDATNLQLLVRDGPAAFEEVFTVDTTQDLVPSGLHPVIAYDMNHDGLSDLLLGGCNRLYWNRGGGKFERDVLTEVTEPSFEVGVVADFTGDARPDYVTAELGGNLILFKGQEKGGFTHAVGKAPTHGPLMQPMAIAAGDIDGDGDLDLWVAQYTISYLRGQMPTPYYDANDGFPAYLLINDGTGRFRPGTEEAGLDKKRNRRTYASSFIDLDGDGDLDLVVVSDFAGVDVYQNDGHGRFTDVTDKTLDERHLFGMSLTFGDYDLDGKLDFFVTGMASTTARRLQALGLGRPDRPDIQKMRPIMGYGNRMYMGGESGFKQPAFRDQVARTGWAWGAATFDFDNDGDPDIFIANGHVSGQSTKDHCSVFWRHDIYDGRSTPNRGLDELFQQVHRGYFTRQESWDGYQKNVLLMNRSGKGFINVAFLLGLGHEYDARAAISDDIDADGRMDLVVTEDRGREGQVLHVYRNIMETGNNWIGVRLREQGPGRSPVGAMVRVLTPGRTYVAPIVTGDAIMAQHAPVVHFGLGGADHVDAIEVRWPGHRTTRVEAPAINRYHLVTAGD